MMGHMKNLLITIYGGGDEAVEAAKQIAGLSEIVPHDDEPGWIPVDESLPPLMTEVLGWHPSDRVRAWFRHSGTVQGGPQQGTYWESWEPQDRECDDCEVDEPTHWMLTPEPPEVK